METEDYLYWYYAYLVHVAPGITQDQPWITKMVTCAA